MSKMWDVIVSTCQDTDSAVSIRNELQVRQRKGLIPKDVAFLVVEDPKPNIGSGSATLNAMLRVAEFLAAREGMTVVSEDTLCSFHILILHMGRTTFPFCPYGHGFMPHPSPSPSPSPERTETWTNFDELMLFLDRLCAGTPPGVWVASTDMLLTSSDGIISENLSHSFEEGITVVTVSCPPEHAILHGICQLTETGDFARIIHRGNMEQVKACCRPDGLSDILTGLVYFNHTVLETLLGLHTMPPLDACTYAGLDNGAEPLALSLFFDILLCLTVEISQQEYVAGRFKQIVAMETLPASVQTKERARSILWKTLKGIKMKALQLSGVQHSYFRPVASDVLERYTKGCGQPLVLNSLVPEGSSIGENTLLLNCNLKVPVAVGKNSFLTGLSESFSDFQSNGYGQGRRVVIPDDVTVQEISVVLGYGRTRTNHSIVAVYGIHDNLTKPMDSLGATFCNEPWEKFFQRTGITETDLWPPNNPRTLLQARLFVVSHTSLEVGVQESLWLFAGADAGNDILSRWRFSWRISLNEILLHTDCRAEFAKFREISFELQRREMVRVLKENKPESFLPFLRHALIEDHHLSILETLDRVALEVSDPLIVCRVYASIADMLGYMAGEVGIRAGPAANLNWRSAFSLLEAEKLSEATKALALERNNWIKSGPDRIIRASRHYERAGQILTRNAVATAKQYIDGSPLPLQGKSVTVYAPARVDLAGGWTDTPPQAYEWGGVVTTLSLTINGKYPNVAVAEKIPKLELELEVLDSEGVMVEHLTLTELSDLANYSQPHAPGALLKAAFICADIVDLSASQSLATQLDTKFGCGFKLRSMSSLPQGSGLGTSSILGGAILAALWRAAGQEHSQDSLIHAVLYLEQLLTTGGGWQDQCGGTYGGAKISQSSRGLPVHITTHQIQLPPDAMETLNQHLQLVYTGKTRLARNLLQDVLRNWHSREERVVRNMQDLVDTARRAATALQNGDVAELGVCLDLYQQQKLIMAPGSLPKVVALFVDKIRDHIHGCSFAGAGGGGFMTIICKQPQDKYKIQQIIHTNKVLEDFVFYEARVEEKGLHYVVE